MSAILNFLRDSRKLRTFLFWYWLISPFIFFIFVYAQTAQTGTDFRGALQNPNIALSFLASCMSIITAYIFKLSYEENEHTERSFALFAIIQQLLVGNPIGFLFAIFLWYALRFEPRDTFAPSKMRWVIVGGMVLLVFLTALTLLARVNQFLSA